MKATRYLHPDRRLEPDMEHTAMNPIDPQESASSRLSESHGAPPAGSAADRMEVEMGKSMPPAHAANLPLLQPQVQAVAVGDAGEGSPACSRLADGMRFIGNAVLRGPCSIAGHVEGNLTQASGAQVAVVVTQTGRVKGDISAQKISVMGHTDGLLDAGPGEVALHDTARVHGRVRYGRIQVNGADLNATLERVAAGTHPS